MPPSADNDTANGPDMPPSALRDRAAAEGRIEGQGIDVAGQPAPAAPGRIGAAPIKWGWWAVGLGVSLGLWYLIIRLVS